MSVESNNATKPFIYYVGSVAKVKTMDDWLYLKIKNSLANYSLINGSALPSFIKYSNGKITVQTSDLNLIGNYTLKFIGCYDLKMGVSYQIVTVLKNTAPFMEFNITNYIFSIKKVWSIQLPVIQDKEMNSAFKVSFKLNSSTVSYYKILIPYFLTLDSKKNAIDVKPFSMIDIGNYTIIVKVAEVDAPDFYSEYGLRIQIIDSNVNTTMNISNSKTPLRGYLT